MDNNDSFYKAVSQRTNIDKTDLILLCMKLLICINMTVNGKIVKVDNRMVARILQHSPKYHGQNIRLLSCNTEVLSKWVAFKLGD